GRVSCSCVCLLHLSAGSCARSSAAFCICDLSHRFIGVFRSDLRSGNLAFGFFTVRHCCSPLQHDERHGVLLLLHAYLHGFPLYPFYLFWLGSVVGEFQRSASFPLATSKSSAWCFPSASFRYEQRGSTRLSVRCGC